MISTNKGEGDFMFSGIGEDLSVLMSYPLLIGSILIFAISLVFLIKQRKTMRKEIKVLFIILTIVTGAISLFLIITAIAFGSNHPPAPPFPVS